MYTDTQPEIKDKLALSLGVYAQLDPNIYKFDSMPTDSQIRDIRKSTLDLVQAARSINAVIKPTDTQSSDVIEDISILDFSLRELVKNCPFIA